MRQERPEQALLNFPPWLCLADTLPRLRRANLSKHRACLSNG